jgi:hypothetical protein
MVRRSTMKKEQLTELGIAEDIAEKILALSEADADSGKQTLTELTAQLEAANTALGERDKQLTELKKSAGDNEELKEKITALQNDNKSQKEAYEAQIRNIRIDSAIESALTKAGARNIKAARALLDMEKVTVDENNEVVGLSEQVQGLTDSEDTKFLFGANLPIGGTPAEGMDNNESLDNMTYTQMCAYLEKNPGTQL